MTQSPGFDICGLSLTEDHFEKLAKTRGVIIAQRLGVAEGFQYWVRPHYLYRVCVCVCVFVCVCV